jgi:hypothetical protein
MSLRAQAARRTAARRVFAAVVVSCCGGAGAFSAAAVPRAGPRTGRPCIALRAYDDRGEKERDREGLLARREQVLREMKNVLEVRGVAWRHVVFLYLTSHVVIDHWSNLRATKASLTKAEAGRKGAIG